ncbi:MAG: polysaccharide pyruvyl transferase family protein [Mesorhizobium sp.]|uniref:polysaccharide pyruvyl transferase family protein n=1 Tax=Mesorhizobium sp. TaxID=1871066 RepID=UPI0011F720D1|nr:polysaccharide pyruvyl transferase family protein [Mesorhizobium sp.]TIN35833.1 MAG: polysaccharide pyruvyl transferase family protein [Mesorhizobium sp.]TJU84584.1 MAG: polysaccharide pyruvyl transferase family protein [Mesorhizobium sp.]
MLIFHGMLRNHNFGDVLLAQICLSWVREIYPYHPIKSVFVTPELSELLGLGHAKIFDILRAKAAVLSGGGYFQIADSGLAPLKRFCKNAGPILLAQMAGRPTALIAVGVGPIPNRSIFDWTTRAGIRLLFSAARLVCLRDLGSVDAFRSLQTGTVPVQTADLVFALRPEDLPASAIDYAESIMATISAGKNVLGLQLSYLKESSPEYLRLYDVLETKISSTEGNHFLLLEDHVALDSGQQRFQAYMKQKLGQDRTTVVPYRGPFQMAALLGRTKGVLTDKLHVGLVAAAMGATPFSLAKHPKNISAYEEIGIPENCALLSKATAKEIEAVVEGFLKKNRPFEVSAKVRGAALENKKLLQEFLLKVLPS